MAPIQSWVWGILAAAVCLLVIIILVVTLIVKRKRVMTSNDVEKNNEQIIIPSQSPTTIEDEAIIIENNNKDATLYGQQFAVVEISQTVLSPPPRERKGSNNSITLTQQEVNPQKARDVFSLSPHQEIEPAPNSISSSRRTITPFQGNTTPINQGWRGPTPPWTHSSTPRQSLNNK